MTELSLSKDKLCVSIPPQLQNEAFRFCKVAKRDKKPIEKKWSKKGYTWNDPALQSWLQAGGNYGVIGGFGDLVIFDADDLARLQELGVMALLPEETFTVRTPGKCGKHVYMICPGVEKKGPLYDPEKTFIDETGKEKYVHVADLIAAKAAQAVGPNSIREFDKNHSPEIRAYEIIKDLPIVTISLDQLQDAIKGLRTTSKIEKKKVEPEPIQEAPAQEDTKKAGYRRWADTLHVEDVMIPDNVIHSDLDGTGEIQGAHPIHGSDSGRNFAINIKKNNWVCFRCHCGGGPWELLGIREGILSCDDCYKGWRRDHPEKWAKVIEKAKELGFDVPIRPHGDSISDYRRDLIRYCVEIIMGSEHIKTTESGEIYIYDNGVYKPNGDKKLATLIEQLGGQQTTNNTVIEVLGKIKRLTSCSFLEFDSDPYRISVQNGILNLNTGKLEPHSPEFLTVIQIPVEYVPGADCLKIKKFMSEIVEEKNLPLLEEMAGYCLLRDYPLHKGFVLLGEGRNGKSTWINLLVNLVSLDNCSSVALQHLGRRFKKAELKGKLINFYTDLPDLTMSLADDFKIVTSGDPTSIERKYFDPEVVRLIAKHIYSANALPKTMDESYGFFSRIILVDFPNRFESENADPFLLQKLTTPEELSGFLNLAISGLKRLLASQRFSYDKEVEDVAEEYKVRSSPIVAILDFMTQATMRDNNGKILKDDLWLAYRGWCLDSGEVETMHSKEELCRAISQGYPVKTTHPRVNGIQKWAFQGLQFSDEGKRLKDLGATITPDLSTLGCEDGVPAY
ncbi:MAG: phage/plasmid primase, P4 family [Methanotrichaceae archaeon]